MSRLVILTTVGSMQAQLMKSQLEANGISVLLSQESAGATYGFTVGAMGLVEVLVAEDKLREAQGILEDSNFTLQDSNNADED